MMRAFVKPEAAVTTPQSSASIDSDPPVSFPSRTFATRDRCGLIRLSGTPKGDDFQKPKHI